MSQSCEAPYGTWVSIYRECGFWPRALISSPDPRTGEKRGKACKLKDWQTPDPELPPSTLAAWDRDSEEWNIGVLMGSPFPDGSKLCALDIDDDRYIRLGTALLGDPVCGRIGKKGIAYFARYFPFSAKPKLKYKMEGKIVAEWFFKNAQVAIPPSVHPETERPYRWVGTALHEVDFRQLPVIKE
jgi:hypothetical protein